MFLILTFQIVLPAVFFVCFFIQAAVEDYVKSVIAQKLIQLQRYITLF